LDVLDTAEKGDAAEKKGDAAGKAHYCVFDW